MEKHTEDLIINMKKYPEFESCEAEFKRTGVFTHPQSIVYTSATVGEGSFIDADCRIENDVVIGKNNYIGKGSVIKKGVVIGDNNHFEMYCSIGTEPEHKAYFGKENKGVIIGNNNRFREFITINAGCEQPTILEDNIVMLRGGHVGHDSKIMSNATLSCNIIIGGHSLIGMYANMGLGSMCHQYSKIGHYSMIGMGAVYKNNRGLPFKTYVGTPAKPIKDNEYFTKSFSENDLKRIRKDWYEL